MNCILKKLLDIDISKETNNEMCVPLPPIVSSLIGSVVFISFMTIVAHLIR